MAIDKAVFTLRGHRAPVTGCAWLPDAQVSSHGFTPCSVHFRLVLMGGQEPVSCMLCSVCVAVRLMDRCVFGVFPRQDLSIITMSITSVTTTVTIIMSIMSITSVTTTVKVCFNVHVWHYH